MTADVHYDNTSTLIAHTLLIADPATLRMALAAVLDECDDLHAKALVLRQLSDDHEIAAPDRSDFSRVRAQASERAIQDLQDALIAVLRPYPPRLRGEAEG
jgi:hypothetical protein